MVLITQKAKGPSLWVVKNWDKHFAADFYHIWIVLSKMNVVMPQELVQFVATPLICKMTSALDTPTN